MKTFLIGFSLLAMSSLSAQAATFTPLPGFTDADFEGLKSSGVFQEDWVAEGRIGNNALNGTFEQNNVNWTTNTTNTTPATNQFIWPNGTAVPFSVNYTTANGGTLTYQLNGLSPLVTTNITEFDRVPIINTLYLRTRSARTDTAATLQNLQLDGSSYTGSLTSSGASDVDYLRITDFSVPFTLTGEAILAWTGTAPSGSSLAFQIKGGYTRPDIPPVPEPSSLLGLLSIGGLGLAMKHRKAFIKS